MVGGEARGALMTAARTLHPIADKDRFPELQAKFALAGHELFRTDERDGPVRLITARWGRIRELRDADEAMAFLRQIGGAV